MKRSEAKLSEQGRVTLPAPVRAALKAKPGDRLIFDQDDRGDVHIRVAADPIADERAVRSDLSLLPKIVRSARSEVPDASSDDPVGTYLLAEDERTKSGR